MWLLANEQLGVFISAKTREAKYDLDNKNGGPWQTLKLCWFSKLLPHREAFFAKRQIYKKPFESGALSEVPVVGAFQIQFFFSREFLGPAKMVVSHAEEYVWLYNYSIYIYNEILLYVYIYIWYVM